MKKTLVAFVVAMFSCVAFANEGTMTQTTGKSDSAVVQKGKKNKKAKGKKGGKKAKKHEAAAPAPAEPAPAEATH